MTSQLYFVVMSVLTPTSFATIKYTCMHAQATVPLQKQYTASSKILLWNLS